MWRQVKLKLAKLSCEEKCVLILHNTFLWVDPCLFKFVCLTVVTLKFMKEKTMEFIFLLYPVLPVHV